MENRTTTIVVRVLLVAALLACTATAAFIAGIGVSRLAETGETNILPTTVSPVPQPTAGDGGPVYPDPNPTPPPTSPDEEAFQLFWEVWDIVQQEYYGEVPDMQAVTYGAIRGMLETLDDEYTSFIEPEIASILNEDASGSFEGIGAFVRMRDDGKLEIVSIIPNSPAEASELRDNDRVLAVDGQSIVGLGIYEAIAFIRGPAGTDVVLLIERPGTEEHFEVTITRARVQIPLVEAEILEGNIAYVRLTEFSSTATAQLEEALEGLMAQRPAGIILDLRNNPGGWLNEAVSVADLFLDDGIVLIERVSDGREEIFESHDGDMLEDIPLVVLVNGGSASASEIVAGAIQDRGRAALIGEQTFGKGSVQRPHRLSDGSELRVTIARWFTPNDVAIHGQGLTPDIEVPLPEELEAGQDPQLERAIEYLLSGE
ncbi:MAG: S41 family peptidase [Anaerolineae bacterium]|nr:S41 family peptidase [Anaerolineae bacterium]